MFHTTTDMSENQLIIEMFELRKRLADIRRELNKRCIFDVVVVDGKKVLYDSEFAKAIAG